MNITLPHRYTWKQLGAQRIHLNRIAPPFHVLNNDTFGVQSELTLLMNPQWHVKTLWGVPARQIFVGQFAKYVGARHIQAYEQRHNVTFTSIVQVRSDYLWYADINHILDVLERAPTNAVVVPARFRFFGVDDRFLAGPRNIMLATLTESALIMTREYDLPMPRVLSEMLQEEVLRMNGALIIEMDVFMDRCMPSKDGRYCNNSMDRLPPCMRTPQRIDVARVRSRLEHGLLQVKCGKISLSSCINNSE